MKNTLIYNLLTLGFVMKAVGGSWDAAYHFKYFRELYQLPHILNGLGNFLILFLLIYIWKKALPVERGPLKILWAGMILFVVAIGFDQWWHSHFGLDLTIWSPAHIALYLGTLVGTVGALLYIAQSYRLGKISRSSISLYYFIFFALLFEPLWFPLIQQEQGVITNYYLQQGIHTMSEELFHAYFNYQRDVYGGIPQWVYGAWATATLVLIFNLVRRFKIHRFASTIVAGEYVLFRFIMNGIFMLASYPQSTVPYYIIPIAFVFDILCTFLERNTPLREIIPNAIILVGVNALGFLNTTYPLHPYIPPEAFAYSILTAFTGYGIYWLAFKKVFQSRVYVLETGS